MLEEQITKLNSSVIELTVAINRLWEEGDKHQSAKTTKTEPKKETKKEPAPKKEPEPKAEGAVSPAELEKMCLVIVRKDPEAKDKIKSVIKAHGGDLVKDVPPERLPDLKAALEAL